MSVTITAMNNVYKLGKADPISGWHPYIVYGVGWFVLEPGSGFFYNGDYQGCDGCSISLEADSPFMLGTENTAIRLSVTINNAGEDYSWMTYCSIEFVIDGVGYVFITEDGVQWRLSRPGDSEESAKRALAVGTYTWDIPLAGINYVGKELTMARFYMGFYGEVDEQGHYIVDVPFYVHTITFPTSS